MPTDEIRDSGSQAWLSGGGEMGKTIRSKDWSNTPLGPIEGWPQSLRTTVSLCLASNFPISLAWGAQFTQIYNDGYWPICGGKHPLSMGQDFRECWASAWPVIGEAFERAVGGETSFLENRRMFLDRNGYLEETFFTFSFSPIRDESGGVGGLFHPVTETTGKMLIERRTRALRDLAGRTGKAQNTLEALDLTAQALAPYELDLPFALLYSVDAKNNVARLAFSNGLTPGSAASPLQIQLVVGESSWPIAEVAESGKPLELSDLDQRFAPFFCGPYPECQKMAMALPITPPGCEHAVAVLIAGVSSRLPLDDLYRNFYEQVAASVTAMVANARAYEADKERVEKLAALDRAKTVFFSNVSHELRTPLTLMLGPLEDTLSRSDTALPARDRENILLAHRSGLRLLKLVNTLLDYSRIQAGRIQACYLPEDLPKLTSSLASVFRSTIEKGGLQLIVECEPLDECVYVDREMWEKIVLNLLSNAFKFTLQGRITVRQYRDGDAVKLSVEDTGCGIAESELGNIFERFYRIEHSEGRTYEGSGIGLALIEELVHLHGGTITVRSVFGQGSIFTVSLPFGVAHLPVDRIGTERQLASTGTRSEAYTEEALRWIQADTEDVLVATAGTPLEDRRHCVLIADDNADMRQYLEGLLGAHFEAAVTPNGEAAWAAILKRRPDLLLCDVMMPKLDGFGLLAKIRANADTATLPVILLSARAGEESKLEGLQTGADDYIIKPFSARELLARVRAHLEISDLRQESVRIEERRKAEQGISDALRDGNAELRVSKEALNSSQAKLQGIIASAMDAVISVDEQQRIIVFNRAAEAVFQCAASEAIGSTLDRFIPRSLREAHYEHIRQFGSAGVTARSMVSPGILTAVRSNGEEFPIEATISQVQAGQGKIYTVILRDITERKQSEQALRKNEERWATTLQSIGEAVISTDATGKIEFMNDMAQQLTRWSLSEGKGRDLSDVFNIVQEVTRLKPENPVAKALRLGKVVGLSRHTALIRRDGTEIPIEESGAPIRNREGQIEGVVLVFHDVSEQRKVEKTLRNSDRLATTGRLAATIAHEIHNPLDSVGNLLFLIGHGTLEDSTREYISMASEELARVSQLTQQMLTFQREAAKPIPVKIGEILDNVIALYDRKIKSAGIKLHVQIDFDGYILALPGELRQVFANLVGNAIEAVGPRNGTITLRAHASLDWGRDRTGLRVVVADDGPGIPVDIRTSIFEPFFTTKGESGTGLGLWITSDILRKYEGSIRLRTSTQSQRSGTCFSVFFPFETSPAPLDSP